MGEEAVKRITTAPGIFSEYYQAGGVVDEETKWWWRDLGGSGVTAGEGALFNAAGGEGIQRRHREPDLSGNATPTPGLHRCVLCRSRGFGGGVVLPLSGNKGGRSRRVR